MKYTLHERLIQRENFWIQKLKILVMLGLNQELGKLKLLHSFFMFLFTKTKAVQSQQNTYDTIVK